MTQFKKKFADKNDILVNKKTYDMYIVKYIKSYFYNNNYLGFLAIENIKTRELNIIGESELGEYKKLDHNDGDCNFCEQHNNGCPHATIEGKCPVENGYSFKYINNKDEKIILDKLILLLNKDAKKRNERYTNVYLEVRNLIEKNKSLNETLKTLLINELKDKNTDIETVIKTFSEKLIC